MSAPMISRLLHMLSPGRINLVDDSGSVQRLQVSERPGSDGTPGLIDGAPSLGLFGFASNPPAKSEVLLARLFGNRGQTVAIATNHQPSRLRNLQPGDSGIYDIRGAKVLLGPAGPIVDAAGLDVMVQNAATVTVKATTLVRVEAPKLECTGDVVANCDGQAVSLAGHVHTEVTSGQAVSGPPQT